MINILNGVQRALFFHAESVYPEECCGFLLGAEVDGFRKITESLPVPNAEGSARESRFLISPDNYRKAEAFAKERGLKLVGVYHSHPDHKALPSQYDLEQGLPWFVSVIIAVTGGTASHMTAWILNESRLRFDEQTMVII